MIFRGPYPDVAIPEVSLTDFISVGVKGIQDKPALIDGPTGRAPGRTRNLRIQCDAQPRAWRREGLRRATSLESSARIVPSTAWLFTP